MRSYLYVNVVQVVISCVIMGGAAANNMSTTDSDKHIADMAFKSNASNVPAASPNISPYEQNIALTSDTDTMAISNGAANMDETSKCCHRRRRCRCPLVIAHRTETLRCSVGCPRPPSVRPSFRSYIIFKILHTVITYF